MNKGYTKRILNKIHQAKVGEVITLHDFPNVPAATANTILNRIAKQQDCLLRVKKGVFSKVMQTQFGIAKATPLEILSSEINKDENKCFGGLFLFNQLGLTTQVPTTIEVLNNKSSYKVQIDSTIVRYVKIRPKITKKIKSYIIILEVIKKIQHIPDSDLEITYNWLNDKLSKLQNSEIKKLSKIALDYPPRVRAVLGNLLQQYSMYEANLLKKSLNDTSYYYVGLQRKYLINPQQWKIKEK